MKKFLTLLVIVVSLLLSSSTLASNATKEVVLKPSDDTEKVFREIKVVVDDGKITKVYLRDQKDPNIDIEGYSN